MLLIIYLVNVLSFYKVYVIDFFLISLNVLYLLEVLVYLIFGVVDKFFLLGFFKVFIIFIVLVEELFLFEIFSVFLRDFDFLVGFMNGIVVDVLIFSIYLNREFKSSFSE